jgi:hypothetical protein
VAGETYKIGSVAVRPTVKIPDDVKGMLRDKGLSIDHDLF